MFNLFGSRQFRRPRILPLDDAGLSGKKQYVHKKSILVLGKDESCDISVTQGAVLDKHCVLRMVNGQVWIKSMAPAYLEGQKLPEHQEVYWPCNTDLTVGTQSFRLTSQLAAWAVVSAVLMMISIGAGSWVFARQLNLFENPSSVYASSKVVSDNVALDMEKVAKDVEEVFRLSGIQVKTEVDRPGVVTVMAEPGHQAALKKHIFSPAMLSIRGLQSIKLISGVNHRTSGIKGIRHLVNGNDKYLVGDDGSRYYRGATLPSGETLLSLSDDYLTLSNSGQNRQVPLSMVSIISPGFLNEHHLYDCVFDLSCPKSPLKTGGDFEEDIANASKVFSIPEPILKAVINVESAFNPEAVSPAGAIGLMQLMPDTAVRFGVDNPYDPAQNIMGGAKYLRFLMDRYNEDLTRVFAAYNAGEGAVDRYAGVPPYAETQAYVVKVKRALQKIEQI